MTFCRVLRRMGVAQVIFGAVDQIYECSPSVSTLSGRKRTSRGYGRSDAIDPERMIFCQSDAHVLELVQNLGTFPWATGYWPVSTLTGLI
jgi:hypothetical protein